MITNLPTGLLLIDPAQLVQTQERIKKNDPSVAPALAALRKSAGQALATPILSVTHKQRLAPSGDPHDYLSMGPYWWPDPAKLNGLPYIRRDGERNPETEQFDSPRLKQLVSAVATLAWAGYFFERKAYFQYAAVLIRAWFLDEATRMNPHLEYGQFIPGVCDGRGIGIIDTSTVFPTLLDAVQVTAFAGALSPAEMDTFRGWMASYLNWNINSPNGKDEAIQHNNHGTWYDVQLAALALFTGQPDLAARVCSAARERRIFTQILPDGSQPHELVRTRSFSYSTMNLTAFLNLAVLANHVEIDLLNYESADGRGIRRALDWLLPYAAKLMPWGTPQITPIDPAGLVSLYRRAAALYHTPSYDQVLAAWPQEGQSSLSLLLYPH